MAITPLPTPPSRDDPANFATRADAFLGALPDFATEANALQTDVTAKQVTASNAATTATIQAGIAADQVDLAEAQVVIATTQAGIATTKAGEASASAVAADASAQAAAALAASFAGTSATSVSVGIGEKTFTTQSGEQYTSGIWVTVVSQANAANYMFGQVVSYSGSTLVVNVQSTGGSGTYADWNISLAGVRGAPGTGITDQAVGWTATGGTSPRTLTVDQSVSTSQLQPTLVSGTNIKTVNGSSVLGGGDLVVGGGGLQSVQVFTSSGTWTKPSGITKVRVRGVGGGGGGGGVTTGYNSAAGGGGAGGYFEKFIDVSAVSTVSVTVGAGGSGGPDGTTNGSTGGTTSFGAYCSATGGQGGYSYQNSPVGGAGGSSSGGDINVLGGGGDAARNNQNNQQTAGIGGASFFGGGGRNHLIYSSEGTGSAGQAYGSGGNGSVARNSTQVGGAGKAGIVIVEEYA